MRTAFKAAALAVLMLGVLLAVSAGDGSEAAEEYHSGDFSYELRDVGNTHTATVTGYTGTGSHVEIPSHVECDGTTYTVRTIGDSAFMSTGIVSVSIPDTVRTIEEFAFDNCKELTEVRLPEGLDSIGDYAFAESALTEISFPSSLGAIGERAFYHVQLETVVLPTNLTTLGPRAFEGNDAVQTVEIPPRITRDGYSGAFADCKSLTEIVPAATTYFQSVGGVLMDSSRVRIVQYPAGLDAETYVVPNSVVSIKEYAFHGCSLSSVVLDSKLTTIGMSAFRECENLESVLIPSSVETIGDSAFALCTSLESFSVAESRNPHFRAVNGVLFDAAMETLVAYPAAKGGEYRVPVGVTSIQGGAFAGAAATSVTLPEGVASLGDRAFLESGILSIDVPEGVRSIGEFCFEGCGSLAEATLPSTLESIGACAFRYCGNLTSVQWSGAPRGAHMDGSAFYGCGLTSFEVPEGVTDIGEGAFYGCADLVSITLPSTLERMGDWALSGTSVVSVTIPEKVTSLEDSLFYGCADLESVTLPSTLERMGAWALAGTSVVSVTIPEKVTSLEDYLFSDCADLETVTLHPGVTSIGEAVFHGCSSLTSLDIPGPLEYLGVSAFAYSGLTSLAIPEGVSVLEPYVFSDCTDLESVSIPASVTSIDASAFIICPSLAEITVAEGSASYKVVDGVLFTSDGSVLVIRPAALEGTEYSVPEGTVEIRENSFDSCDSLETVEIPASVTYIGPFAFYGCSSLTTVALASAELDIATSAFDLVPDGGEASLTVYTDLEPFDPIVFGEGVDVTYDIYGNYGVRGTDELMGGALIWIVVAIVLGIVFLVVALRSRA